jgi:hypothetical protein
MENETVEFTAQELAVLKDEAVPETKPEEKPAEVVAEKDAQPRTEEGKFDSPAGEKEPKLVPLNALHEERERRKELADELKREREERLQREAKLQERLDTLFRSRQEAEQPKAPTWDDSPLDAGKATTQEVQQIKAHLQQQAQQKQFADAVGMKISEFRTTTPDYDAAYQHLIQSRTEELALIYGPEQARQFVGQEEFNIALAAMQQGKNPAEVAYALAKQRGYARAEQKAAEPAKPTEAEKLEVIERGQASATSLAAAGGAPAGGPLTLDMIAKMSDDEFATLTDKQWRKVMGAA